jgi:hypothetical protein
MLDRLPADVRTELADTKFIGRKHYSRGTYALGCHGPLCKKAERDRGRVRNEVNALNSGRAYTPNMLIRLEEDELLDQIVEWYLSLREKSKAS